MELANPTEVVSQTRNESSFDVEIEMNELRNQISLIKRIGFFFGAGSSMALGIPGISTLTDEVKIGLEKGEQELINIIEESIQITQNTPVKITVEDILNQCRLIRQITKDSPKQEFQKIDGEQAKKLDLHICRKIYQIISDNEEQIDFSITEKLLSCINWFCRDYAKEIFTTNYDLIFEKSFEKLQIPYFDGFVGAYEPFFLPDSIEGSRYDYPPISWIRLWKIHGSLGWFWKRSDSNSSVKVIRLGVKNEDAQVENNELVIYPSKEKYELSRKQPFIAYFDRLKHFLIEGEGLFIVSGYSFSDEHINEIFFNALQQNNRLHIIAFLFCNEDMEKVQACCKPFLNFTAYGPTSAIISGNYRKWDPEITNKNTDINVFNSFWNSNTKEFKLNEYKNLVQFFIEISGKHERIPNEQGGK
jgi:hypothetical protein